MSIYFLITLWLNCSPEEQETGAWCLQVQSFIPQIKRELLNNMAGAIFNASCWSRADNNFFYVKEKSQEKAILCSQWSNMFLAMLSTK